MSIKRNLINNSILSAGSILFPLIIFPYVTRTLSVANYGKVALVDAFTQYFIIFSSIGIPYYGIREIAKRKDNDIEGSQLLIELFMIQISLAIFFSLIFLMLPLLLLQLQSERNLVYLGCSYILFSSFMIEWYYQGIEKFKFIAQRTIFIKIITAVLIFCLVKTPADYIVYYSITVLSILLNGVVNFGYFLKNHYRKSHQKTMLLRHLKPLLILFSMNVSISVYTLFDSIILGMLKTPVEVSMYSVPLKFIKAFWTFGAAIGVVMISRMSKLVASGNDEQVKDLIKKSNSLVFLITIPFAALCLLCPKEILNFLAGPQYVASYNTLRILGFVPLIIGICNVLGTQFLLPIGKEKYILYATVGGLVVSLVFNFTLVPLFSYIGTSISCVLAELTVLVIVFLSARKFIAILVDYKLLLQILISVLVSVAFYEIACGYLKDLYLLFACCFVYGFTFLLTQFTIFKNPLIRSMMRIKSY